MLDNSKNKQKKVKFLDYLPNMNVGNTGDIVLSKDVLGFFLGIKGLDEWKFTKISSLNEMQNIIGTTLNISSTAIIKGQLHLRGDLRTPKNMYLRNSKIYFDMSETTPNDYITGGANDLEFYTSGTKRLDIGVTSSTFSNALIASSTLEVSDDIKLASTKKLYFDGGQDTYITSSPDNQLNFYTGGGVGATNILNLTHNAITSIASDITIENSVSTKPILTLKNTTNDAEAPYIKLLSQRGATAADAQDSDYLGYIEFNGYDDGTPSTQTYATISSNITNASSGDEVGSLFLKAAANNGTLASGISLIGDASALRADTTIHGKLTVNSISSGDGSGENFLVENSGEVQKRTAAEVRSDIGAGTSSVAALNDLSDVTYSSGDLTISSIDTIISGDLTIDSSGDIELNADNGHITFKDDTTTGLSIDIPDSTISLPQDYKLIFGNADEYIYGDGNKLNIAVGDGDVMTFYDEEIRTFKTLKMQERADAESDTAGYGQLWVDTATPNELAFTDDAGTDIIGIGKYHYECKFIGFNASATGIYLPMTGYIFEQTLTAGRNEYLSFIAPYNATIEKVAFRTEIAQDGAMSVRVSESSDATEIPGTMIFRKDHTYDIADDIYTEFDLTSPSIGSFPIPITKGRIYLIYLKFANAPYDTNVNVVFKWDITS